jgi:DNA-binding NarL/FixJ family response regulator
VATNKQSFKSVIIMAKRVIAYDDEPALRKQLEGVFYTLRADFNLVATFPNAKLVLDDIKTHKPDIVLLDIDMRETNEDGLLALYAIKNKYPNQIVMMLTTFDDDEKIFNAICLGADGYMLKSDFVNHLPHEVMRRSLNIILSDGAYLTPAVARKILSLFRDKGISTKINKVVERFKNMISKPNKPIDPNMEYKLKPIQLDILTEIVAGKNSKKIAESLKMPENTVNHHIKGIYRELEAHSRAAVVRKAIEEKLVLLKN